ncbi:MAG: cob(I)yrinic acid a,c-diamide adenosyltransferase [Bacteroidales bacterium]
MEWKIYTKMGDKGETSLMGGTRVPKYHKRIEAYGTLDELNAYIGLVRDQEIDAQYKKTLIEIQDRLFTIESMLAKDPEKTIPRDLPAIVEKDVRLLEKEIDQMNEDLEPLQNFILPGGHTTVSHCHVARCVCRRAERLVISLASEHVVDELNIKYLNRLSDYLFVLARKLAKDLGAAETPWKARV